MFRGLHFPIRLSGVHCSHLAQTNFRNIWANDFLNCPGAGGTESGAGAVSVPHCTLMAFHYVVPARGGGSVCGTEWGIWSLCFPALLVSHDDHHHRHIMAIISPGGQEAGASYPVYHAHQGTTLLTQGMWWAKLLKEWMLWDALLEEWVLSKVYHSTMINLWCCGIQCFDREWMLQDTLLDERSECGRLMLLA